MTGPKASVEAVVKEHLPYLGYGIWRPKEDNPVELVFKGRGRFDAFFTSEDEFATSHADGVHGAYLWCGQLRVRLNPEADPHSVGKTVVDLLLAIRCLNAGLTAPAHFDTPNIFKP